MILYLKITENLKGGSLLKLLELENCIRKNDGKKMSLYSENYALEKREMLNLLLMHHSAFSKSIKSVDQHTKMSHLSNSSMTSHSKFSVLHNHNKIMLRGKLIKFNTLALVKEIVRLCFHYLVSIKKIDYSGKQKCR